MYRVRSTDVWHNAPGIVCAYQPVAAPDSFAAQQNVANGGSNSYWAASASYPGWTYRSGWIFNNAHYIDTKLSQGAAWTVIVRWSDPPSASDNGYRPLLANNTPVYNQGHELIFKRSTNQFSARIGYGVATIAVPPSGGVSALSGGVFYHNDAQAATGLDTYPATTSTLILGAQLVFSRYLIGNIQAFAVYQQSSRALLSMASRQMAYCHVNPDWSAWGRRRRYYYAPSVVTVASNVGIYGRRGSVALPGGVRIEAVR